MILGIDPGSLKTGFGVINHLPKQTEYVSSGVIRIQNGPLPDRLNQIFASIHQVIEEYAPQEMAIENVFMAKNAASALKLGQARGAAIVAATQSGLSVAEYEARKVKQAVVGSGAAEKLQMQQMVKHLLRLPKTPQEDAADALGVALCHAITQQYLIRTSQARHYRRGRLV